MSQPIIKQLGEAAKARQQDDRAAWARLVEAVAVGNELEPDDVLDQLGRLGRTVEELDAEAGRLQELWQLERTIAEEPRHRQAYNEANRKLQQLADEYEQTKADFEARIEQARAAIAAAREPLHAIERAKERRRQVDHKLADRLNEVRLAKRDLIGQISAARRQVEAHRAEVRRLQADAHNAQLAFGRRPGTILPKDRERLVAECERTKAAVKREEERLADVEQRVAELEASMDRTKQERRDLINQVEEAATASMA